MNDLNNHLLKLIEVSVHYGKAIAIASINIELDLGESVAIIGPNGTGKTTLMKAIMGLVELERGRIYLRDQLIRESSQSDFRKISKNKSLKTHDIVRLGITLCPERRQLFSESTVYENLVLGAYTIDDQEEIEKRIEWVSKLFPIIAERLHDEAGKFSGGQQQMIAIARSLMRKPSVLLLDEPSLGLAPFIKKTIVDAIHEINKTEKNMSILVVEQDITMAFQMCSRGYVMENGRIRYKGSKDEILSNPYVREAFLGL
jgi:branched-chain amino acid transport system ATP-binding protein